MLEGISIPKHEVGILAHIDTSQAFPKAQHFGGNQSDGVTVRDYSRDRLLCWRWPAKELDSTGGTEV